MNRFYIFINRETTFAYVKKDKEINKCSFEKNDYIHNTLEYSIDEWINFSSHEYAYLNNRYSAFGPGSDICGIHFSPFYKLLILMEKIMFGYFKVERDEVVIVLEKEAKDSLYKYLGNNVNKMFHDIFEILNLKVKNVDEKNEIIFKGCLLYDNLMYGFLEKTTHFYNNGCLYIDDSIISYYDKKRGFSGNWREENLKIKKEIDEKFYNYLKVIGFPLDGENIENIKNYIIHNAKKDSYLSKIPLVIRDEEYIIDGKIVSDYIMSQNRQSFNDITNYIDRFGINYKTICFVKISDSEIKNAIIKFLLDRGCLLYNKIDLFMKKLCDYIDLVIKYNSALYRKRIKELLFTAREKNLVIQRLCFDREFAYSFDEYLNEREKKEVDRILNIKELNN